MITKRQLGIGLLYLGVLVVVGTIFADVIGVSEYEGVGPAQRVAFMGGGLLIFIGLTLLPLGKKDA